MTLPDFLDELKNKIRQLSEISFAAPNIQAKHELLLEQHFELLDTIALAAESTDNYPLFVALDMMNEIRDSTKELAKLLKARA